MSISVSSVTPADAPPHGPLDGAALVALYRTLVLAEALDARLTQEVEAGALEAWSGSGVAAGALVGAASALEDGDWLFAGPRDLAAALTRGVGLDVVVSHVFATTDDATRGRVQPQRLAVRGDHGLRGPIAGTGFHNGAHLTHAAGVAWGARIKKERTVALALFDENELASGEVHNALNFAGVFKLPVVFVAVRGAADPIGERTSARGVAYGLPTVTVDGDDLLAVHHAVRDAAARARRGEGSTLVEATATGAEAAIARFDRVLQKNGADEAAASARVAASAEVEAAVSRAKAALPPAPETMFDDVYASPPWHLLEEKDALGRARSS